MAISNLDELTRVVQEVVQKQPITDMHTHLYSPNMGNLLLWGVDALLTYHYLVAEVMRWSDVPPDTFYAWPVEKQSAYIWQTLFIEHSPVSEAERGVLTSLKALGLDPATRDLDAYRKAFASVSAETEVNRAMQLANISHVVMTNDPFDDAERPYWEKGVQLHQGFHAALRIDPLLRGWAEAQARLQGWGYRVHSDLAGDSANEVKRFLRDWVKLTNPVYMAVSLPPTFSYPRRRYRHQHVEGLHPARLPRSRHPLRHDDRLRPVGEPGAQTGWRCAWPRRPEQRFAPGARIPGQQIPRHCAFARKSA